MKVLLVGCGSVGGITAATLLRAGRDVAIVTGNPEISRAIDSRGIVTRDPSRIVKCKDEYWVFYKVAEMVLSPGALIESRSSIVKDGRIVNGATVSDGSVRVNFNRSFSRGAGKSYSLSFRPDIVVESPGLKPARLHVIDAKYKHVDVSDSESDSDGVLEKTFLVKPADIHKMHCYVDAIDGTASAVAAYPGTHFVFYPRDRLQGVVQSPDQVGELRGVGAVPLLPGKGYGHFESFAELLKKDLANASKV